MKKMLLLMVPALLCSTGAYAAEKMKPGLWEMTIKSDMMKAMPKLPPEQMEQMRKMGIDMPKMGNGGMVTRMCITKEMAERSDMPEMNSKETGCINRNQQTSGSTYSVEVVCDGPQLKGVGKLKGSLSGSERYTANYDFKGTMNGQPVNQQSETTGKWVSADCGNIKPVEAMQRKK